MNTQVTTGPLDRLVECFLVLGLGDTLEPAGCTDEMIPMTRQSSIEGSESIYRQNSASGTSIENDANSMCRQNSCNSIASTRSLVHPLRTTFKATILDRYPFEDYDDRPLDTVVLPILCFPKGLRLKRPPPPQQPLPTFFTVVLTDEKAINLYCHCLTIWDELSPAQVEAVDVDAAGGRSAGPIYCPKALCLVSRWNFPGFKTVLSEWYRMTLSPMQYPLERVVGNFVTEVPLPPSGLIETQYNIGATTVTFRRPPLNHRISPMGLNFQRVFECLSLDNILFLFRAMATEIPILLHSSQLSLLTDTAEVLVSLLYPLRWQGMYTPVLPVQCRTYVASPSFYIYGMHTDIWRVIDDIPSHVAQVDLDRNQIICDFDDIPELPNKQRNKLLKSLRQHGNAFAERKPFWEVTQLNYFDMAFDLGPRPSDMGDDSSEEDFNPKHRQLKCKYDWHEVRAAFLRFWSSLFMDYRRFLVPVSRDNPDPLQRFEKRQFLQTLSTEAQPFAKRVLGTQAWAVFESERTSPESMGKADVVFFDQTLDAKVNRHLMTRWKGIKFETPFLDTHEFDIRRTVLALAPDTSNLPESRTYVYTPFPPLEPSYFSEPRPVTSHSDAKTGLALSLGDTHSAHLHRSKPENGSSRRDADSLTSLTNSTAQAHEAQAAALVKWAQYDPEKRWSQIQSFVSSVWFLTWTAAMRAGVARISEDPNHDLVTPTLHITSTGAEIIGNSTAQRFGMFSVQRNGFTSTRKGHRRAHTVGSFSTQPPPQGSLPPSNTLHEQTVTEGTQLNALQTDSTESDVDASNTAINETTIDDSSINSQDSLNSTQLPEQSSSSSSSLAVSSSASLLVASSSIAASSSSTAVSSSSIAASSSSTAVSSSSTAASSSSTAVSSSSTAVSSSSTAVSSSSSSSSISHTSNTAKCETSHTNGTDKPAVQLDDVQIETSVASPHGATTSRRGARLELVSPTVRMRDPTFQAQMKEQYIYALEQAFMILERMRENGISVSESVCRLLLDMCSRAGSTQRAQEVLQLMAQIGMTPDHTVFARLFRAFALDHSASGTISLPLGVMDWNKFRDSDSLLRHRSSSVPSSSGQPDARTTNKTTTPDLDKKQGSIHSKNMLNRIGRSLLSPTHSNHPRQPDTGFNSHKENEGRQSDLTTTSPEQLSSTSFAGRRWKVPSWLGGHQAKSNESSASASPKNASSILTSMNERIEAFVQLNEHIVEHDSHATDESSDSSFSPFGLLNRVFPGLRFDVCRETCPTCEHRMTVRDICMGWVPNPNDYTTICPICSSTNAMTSCSNRNRGNDLNAVPSTEAAESSPVGLSSQVSTTSRLSTRSTRSALNNPSQRFVARFMVTCEASWWRGSTSQGAGAPLFVEFLSPWTLHKELQSTLDRGAGLPGQSIRMFSSLRDEAEAVYWNLVLWYTLFEFPSDFLVAAANGPLHT